MADLTKSSVSAGANTTGVAYAAGNLIGSLIDLGDLVPNQRSSLVITGVAVEDSNNQKSNVDVVFFDANPSATTFTDHAAFAVAAADLDKVCGYVVLAAYEAFSANAIAFAAAAIPAVTPGHLFAAIVCRGTPTFTVTPALTLKVTVDRSKAGS